MSLFKSVVQRRVIQTLWTQQKGPLSTRISVSGNKESYFPGEDIRGEVHLSYNEEFSYCGLKLCLEGIVSVKYREQKQVFQKKESILTESEYLVGACGQKKLRSKPGTQTSHSFSFTVPSVDIPGTYKDPVGHIFYRLILFIDYGDNKLVQKACKQIIIKSKLDLDPDDPCTTEPVDYERVDEKAKSKQIAYNKRVTEPQLKFRFSLDQTGFLCGENIHFTLDLENPKKRYNITTTTVELLERISYHGGKITKKQNTILATTSQPVVEELDLDLDSFSQTRKEKSWEGSLRVPKGLMPSQKGLIEFEYFLRVSVHLKNNDIKALTGEYPIIVAITRDGVTVDHERESSSYYSETAVESNSKRLELDDDDD